MPQQQTVQTLTFGANRHAARPQPREARSRWPPISSWPLRLRTGHARPLPGVERRVNKNRMVLATASVGLFVALDLAATWSHHASMLILYSGYRAKNDSRSKRYCEQSSNMGVYNLTFGLLASPSSNFRFKS